MSATLLTEDVWPDITRAVRNSSKPCFVAVAYFGSAGSRLLPLPANSRLIVDASEQAVSSGQTCPAELIKLLNRKVRIFSVPNLHAKVFVAGRSAYIGSTNASGRSASQLVEAVVKINEPNLVKSARRFIERHCAHELGPKSLERLTKLYRPPRAPKGVRGIGRIKRSSSSPILPKVFVAQMKLEDWSERDQALHDAALTVAKKRRKHPRTFEIDSFRCTGGCKYSRGDVVVQVTDEGFGRVLVTPPGTVLHVRTRSDGNRRISFVYLECPRRRRRSVSRLAQALGHGALTQLRRDGAVRDGVFAQKLLNIWAR